MYSESFKNFVSKDVKYKYFVGTGNPNGPILLIGKESAISPTDSSKIALYKANAINWQTHIQNNTCEILEYPVDKTHEFRKGSGNNTWSNYQKLLDYTREKESQKLYVDFLNCAFTTEMNDSPELKTSNADKNSIDNRKKFFKESDFIQSFPVIVLACSNYITNNDNVRDIDDTFQVKYDGDKVGKHWYSKSNWFYTHHNNDGTKLVIHTRQLSANVKDELLRDMSVIIREHLEKIGRFEFTKPV